MAIIGFIFLVCVGGYFAFLAIGMFFLGLAFRSNEAWVSLLPGAVSAFCFYVAATHAPFVISMAAS